MCSRKRKKKALVVSHVSRVLRAREYPVVGISLLSKDFKASHSVFLFLSIGIIGGVHLSGSTAVTRVD